MINELGSSEYFSTFDLPGAYQLLQVTNEYVKNTVRDVRVTCRKRWATKCPGSISALPERLFSARTWLRSGDLH
jgi:hypothetical protein